jgi:hypothetical protein
LGSSIDYASSGDNIADIFEAMRGQADLHVALRADADWERPPEPGEQLRLGGASRLVIEAGRVKGVQIENINIDAIRQHLSGDISLVAGRKPWLVARLVSERLDLTEVLTWKPESAGTADPVDVPAVLRDLGEVNVSFTGGAVDMMGTPLRNVILELSSKRDHVDFERLDFEFEGSHVEGRLALNRENDLAVLKASATVTGLRLDDFLQADAIAEAQPLSGSIQLAGRGTRLNEIASSLRARLLLSGQATAPRRQLQADLQRLPQGFRADIESLAWNDSELTGSVLYHDTSPALLEVTVGSGTLDLRPWEERLAQETGSSDINEPSTPFSRAARVSSQLVSGLLSTPKQMLSASPEATPRDRFFSDKPLDTSQLSGREARISGQLESILSSEGIARDLEFDIASQDGSITATISAGFLNGGSARAELDIDTTTQAVPGVRVKTSFKDVHRNPEQKDSPRTGFLDLHSRGSSEAELAANLNGTGYLELGRGPLKYGRMTLLSTDVATGMFRRLLPGTARKQPELRCGITLGTFTDGIGITPYGYAVRTNTANLLGNIEVDLREEQLLMQFRSRSREGAGLSLANAFSATVNISGPLNNPKIVPNTGGMLFRGWAAFMTAGISMLGESMYNRTLASTNPCEDIRAMIRKNICAGDTPAAASPLVCPP